MKNQKLLQLTKRATAIAGAAVLAAITIFGGQAMAANTYGTTIGGTKSAEFSKYLVMEKGISVPTVAFSYSITAGTPVAAATGKMEVLAGVDAEKVTISGAGGTTDDKKIQFSNKDAAVSDTNANIKAHPTTSTAYDASKHQYVEKKATLNFGACSFKEPGIYRYVLSETTTPVSGVAFDAAPSRIVDVYVINDTADMTLKIEGIILHASADDVAAGADMGSDGTDPAGKSVGFTNWYDPASLTIEHSVSGNQASQDKYFKYTVEIQGAANAEYLIDLTDAEASFDITAATKADYNGKKNVTNITANSSGSASVELYLQHGQKITIKGLKDGDTYTVKVDKEDYKAEVNSNAYVDGTGYTGTIAVATDAKPKAAFTLTRKGSIPTGVIMTVAPFAAIAAVGAAGIFGVTRKKKEDEE